MIAENRKIKEEENIKNSKVNALKRAGCMNLRATSFAKLLANLPNDIMDYEDPSYKSSSPSQPASSRTHISISAEIWVSFRI